MPTLTLAIKPMRAISTGFEAPEFRLVLRNPGDTDIPIPRGWFAGARLETLHPDGRRSVLMPFGEESNSGVAPGDEIFSRSDREQRFTLADAALPGAYELRARLAFDPELEAETDWFLEAPRPVSLAVPSVAGVSGGHAWILVPGEKQATLLDAPIAWCDVAESRPMRAGSPGRVAVADPSARGLVASALQGSLNAVERERVAWLSAEGRLEVGVTAVLFDSVGVALPGAPRRILGPLLVDEGGRCAAFVLSGDDRTVWAFRGDAAVAREAPPAPPEMPLDFDVPDDLDAPAPFDDEEDEEPSFVPRADVPPPSLAAAISLPFAATHGAAAAGPDFSGLLLAGMEGDSIEVLYVALDERLGPRARGLARIPGARLMPGCDPLIEVDDEGLARVAVLFHEPGNEAVGLAKLAFDDAGQLVWREGVGRQRLAILGSPPVDGALAVADSEDWSLAWCVRTEAAELVGCRVGAAPRTRLVRESLVEPLFLLASADRLAVATESVEGISFEDV
jgi:hypothetical protein